MLLKLRTDSTRLQNQLAIVPLIFQTVEFCISRSELPLLINQQSQMLNGLDDVLLRIFKVPASLITCGQVVVGDYVIDPVQHPLLILVEGLRWHTLTGEQLFE